MLSRLSFLLLLIIILLESLCGHAESPGKLQKPNISVDRSVQNNGVVNIACDTKLESPISSTNISCNLYIGDSSEPFRRTWTTSKPVCNFEVNISDLQKSREVSCDYSLNTDPRSPSPRSDRSRVVGKLPKAELQLSAAVISIEESVNLRCRRPDSAPASHCTFTINQRGPISGSDCERSVTGAELLSGSHSVRNKITVRCSYGLEGGPALQSDPSKVTVLDLRKPNISVSTEHTKTHIRCEAPPDITGAIFFLYYNRSRTHSKSTQAVTEERAVSFTVPRSSDSTLTYCCRYQFKGIKSKLSDCAEAKNKDQSGRTNNQSKLPKPKLELSPAVISIKDSMNLRCSRPDSAPASHCTFTINQRGPISGSDCERSVTGAELLSGSHSARNEITVRCFYSLEEGGKLARHSEPSTVTVLDLRKPNISTEHTETHIRCEAPPDITGAIFFLYFNRNRTHTKETQAVTEERAVSFTVPRSSDSTLTYCCRYQFKGIKSKLSDCAEAKNKDQSGRTNNQTWLNTPAGIGVILTVIVILLGMTGAGLYRIHRKRKSSGLPTTPNNDAVYTTVDVSKGAGSSDATSPSDVTYSTVAHLAPQTTAFQAQQDNVVYSSLKTD